MFVHITKLGRPLLRIVDLIVCYGPSVLSFIFGFFIALYRLAAVTSKITPTLENAAGVDVSFTSATTMQASSYKSGVKRAKWHLGIRSQSRPGQFE